MHASPVFAPPAGASPLRVSESEREHTVGLLREHWVAGRLTLDELEDRSEEAWAARYALDLWCAVRELPVLETSVEPRGADRRGEAAVSVLFSATGATLLLLSFGMLFLLALPLSASGWAMARGLKRDPALRNGRTLALVGEILGGVGTVSACLALTACVAWVV